MVNGVRNGSPLAATKRDIRMGCELGNASESVGMKTLSKKLKRAVLFQAQKGKCAICGRSLKLADSTLDHIVPKALGGGGSLANMRLAHGLCNNSRGKNMDDVFVKVGETVALRYWVKGL